MPLPCKFMSQFLAKMKDFLMNLLKMSHTQLNLLLICQYVIIVMDLDYLENALENLDLKPEQIHNVADYCITNNVNSEQEITKLIQKHFFKHVDPRPRTALFLLASELFFLANLRKNMMFFKHLSPKIRPFLEALLIQATESLQLGSLIIGAIDKWAIDQLFVDNFLERIKDVANPIYKKVAEERAGGGKHEKFTKYKKTFLMELMDVRKFEPTSKVYDTYIQMMDITSKLNSFQQAYNKIDFDNLNEDTLKRAKELQKATDDYKERLETVISGLHAGFKLIADECREDFSKLERTD